ncbi:RNA polymerase sigma factor [Arsenicibacter rosenii]|uniref:RNA polymerase subunit sigma-24 n=1 Tax=Arsenicibacter rosenii TaxID=1750698 RepID=A0A1S2VG55_9BACT|nr:sigma-70 family RNA polymerase sigma factor [Arsenicibacter rosenii]OIN57255.1 RNA polymerase subunit sigma-24 [Arsenicibacter rosenii]
MKSYTDEELVKLYVETQRNQYFEVLYSRYCDKVYRKCLSFTKDPARAEDFTHDIFLKLIVKLGGFKEQSRFSTWLYSVTYNHCMDHVRSKKNVEVLVDDDHERLFNYSDEDNDLDLSEMSIQGLRKAMEKMTTEERSLLLLKYQDDVTIRDMAEILNLTDSAVKMRLKRAKDKLKKRYLESVVFGILVTLRWISSKFPVRWF